MAEETIIFKGNDLPVLAVGEHSISPSVTFNIPGISQMEFKSPDLNILIAGPRFIFSPKDIYAVFPPRDSLGEYDNVLPHIELEQAYLPWIRAVGNGDNKTPWLALILLQEEEWTDSGKVTIEYKQWKEYRDSINLRPELMDEPSDGDKPFPPLKILNIKKEFLQKILPGVKDMKWLSHVRVGHNVQGEEAARAVLVCNRMPKSGARAAVHLVSLEGRCNDGAEFNYTLGQQPDGKVPLLSIYSWEFSCPDDEQFNLNDKTLKRIDDALREKIGRKIGNKLQKDTLYRGKPNFVAALEGFDEPEQVKLINTCHIQTETFKGLMDALDLHWMHIPIPEGITEAAGDFFEAGSIPLAHGLRQGGKTASWYRGPLIAEKALSEDTEENLKSLLPIRRADHLLFHNEATGMLDVTYATAWELGRLLALSDPTISQQIAQWKTSHAREVALAEQNLAFSHIPFTDSSFVHQSGGLLEQKLQQYFEGLGLLKGIPFHYLVPNEQFLPNESLRFFYIDPLWVGCLLDGAFSIGRLSQVDQDREKKAKSNLLSAIEPDQPTLMGILLRSDLVSGWPSLMVEAFNKEKKPLTRIRFERLGSNVLIALFTGKMDTLALHLPPESLHFGFSRPLAEDGAYFKELKNMATGEEILNEKGGSLPCSVPFRQNDSYLRVVSIEGFIGNMNNKLKTQGAAKKELDYQNTESEILAIQLIEGVPRLEVAV